MGYLESGVFRFYQHEPLFYSRGPMRVTSRHLRVICSVYFLHQHRSIGKVFILPVVFSRTG
jgi:hypothetical protein